jgi:hypothetical protein
MTDLEKAAFKHVFESTLHLKFEIRTSSNVELDKAVRPYIEAIGDYNEYNPERVMNMLKEFDKLAPKKHYETHNPNEGSRVWDIRLGREGSCVLYIHWYDFGWSNYDKDAMRDAVTTLETIAINEAKADEFDYQDKTLEAGISAEAHEHEIRMWWD